MHSKVLERLKQQQKERIAHENDIKNRAIEKAKYKILLEQKIIADREAKKLKLEYEKEEKIRLAEEKRLADIEAKTHKYYDINQYGRKKAVEGAPLYFGETIRIFPNNLKDSAWIANGYGEFFYDGSVQREGTFIKGKLFGEGKYNFNESNYFGEFKNDNMYGNGIIVTEKNKDIVLMRNNIIICKKTELIEGKQIEIDDPSIDIWCNKASVSDTIQLKNNSIGVKKYNKIKEIELSTSEYISKPISQLSLLQTNGINKIKATIIKHIYDWRYLIRFHDEIYPKQREVKI